MFPSNTFDVDKWKQELADIRARYDTITKQYCRKARKYERYRNKILKESKPAILEYVFRDNNCKHEKWRTNFDNNAKICYNCRNVITEDKCLGRKRYLSADQAWRLSNAMDIFNIEFPYKAADVDPCG